MTTKINGALSCELSPIEINSLLPGTAPSSDENGDNPRKNSGDDMKQEPPTNIDAFPPPSEVGSSIQGLAEHEATEIASSAQTDVMEFRSCEAIEYPGAVIAWNTRTDAVTNNPNTDTNGGDFTQINSRPPDGGSQQLKNESNGVSEEENAIPGNMPCKRESIEPAHTSNDAFMGVSISSRSTTAIIALNPLPSKAQMKNNVERSRRRNSRLGSHECEEKKSSVELKPVKKNKKRIPSCSVSNETSPPITSTTEKLDCPKPGKKLKTPQPKPTTADVSKDDGTSDCPGTTVTTKKCASSAGKLSHESMASVRDKSVETDTFALPDSSSEKRGHSDRRRSKRAQDRVRHQCMSTMSTSAVEKPVSVSLLHPIPKPTVAKPNANQSTLSSNMIHLDSKILDNLTDQSSLRFYHEESAYRHHNPPFPECGPSQLALVRDVNIPGTLHPVHHEQLTPLPLPSHIPELPSTGFCTWTYDDKTRVLFANFRVSPYANGSDGKLHVTREDEQFLLKMMERDDITVISQGLLDEINSSLLGREYVEGTIGSRFHHKVKEFKKTVHKPCDSVPTGEVNDQYEERGWYSMKITDYFKYIDRRQKLQGCNAINEPQLYSDDGNTDELFEFTDHENRLVSINPREVVLYMLDLDMVKMLPRAYDDFIRGFKLPSLLPGGLHCMMNAVNVNGRPFMGPNIYITPPSSFTHFHQDGNGTVDSGHYCHRGYNEVIMLRRLPERHKHHALHLLTGRSAFTTEFLYGKPHDQETQSRWPTNESIESCIQMGYCPSVFILKPGQLLHINKGRLHAFRKLSRLPLHETDCHYLLRNEILPSIGREDFVCVSVAWDWMFKGITSQGINREVASILECARLNQTHHVQSLAIPETALLFMAEEYISMHMIKSRMKTSVGLIEFTPDPKTVLKGILPSLHFVVHRHQMAEKISKTWVEGGKHKKVSIDPKPISWQNPDTFSMDPYGSGDFICKFCLEELSNVFMHCDGCERLLNKDFNICTSCHANEKYKANIKMHPFNPKMKSTLNHTGIVNFQRQSRCPCKNGPQCDTCSFCIGCSCTCHQQFTLHYRFMLAEEERELLHKAEAAVGADIVPATLDTKVRLFSLLSGDFQVPLESFSNEGMCADLKPGEASSTVDLASTISLSTSHKTAEDAGCLDDDVSQMGVEGSCRLYPSRIEELTLNQDSIGFSVHPALQDNQVGPFSTESIDLIEMEDVETRVVNAMKPTSTSTKKIKVNSHRIYNEVQNAPSHPSLNDSAPKNVAGNISISTSKRPSKMANILTETARNEVGNESTLSDHRNSIDSFHKNAYEISKVDDCFSEGREEDVTVNSDVVEDADDSDSDPISPADLDALQPGSRVVVYYNSNYWNATIIKRGNKLTEGKFQIHYDGRKRRAKNWIREEEIARIL